MKNTKTDKTENKQPSGKLSDASTCSVCGSPARVVSGGLFIGYECDSMVTKKGFTQSDYCKALRMVQRANAIIESYVYPKDREMPHYTGMNFLEDYDSHFNKEQTIREINK